MKQLCRHVETFFLFQKRVFPTFTIAKARENPLLRPRQRKKKRKPLYQEVTAPFFPINKSILSSSIIFLLLYGITPPIISACALCPIVLGHYLYVFFRYLKNPRTLRDGKDSHQLVWSLLFAFSATSFFHHSLLPRTGSSYVFLVLLDPSFSLRFLLSALPEKENFRRLKSHPTGFAPVVYWRPPSRKTERERKREKDECIIIFQNHVICREEADTSLLVEFSYITFSTFLLSLYLLLLSFLD